MTVRCQDARGGKVPKGKDREGQTGKERQGGKEEDRVDIDGVDAKQAVVCAGLPMLTTNLVLSRFSVTEVLSLPQDKLPSTR